MKAGRSEGRAETKNSQEARIPWRRCLAGSVDISPCTSHVSFGSSKLNRASDFGLNKPQTVEPSSGMHGYWAEFVVVLRIAVR